MKPGNFLEKQTCAHSMPGLLQKNPIMPEFKMYETQLQLAHMRGKISRTNSTVAPGSNAVNNCQQQFI